MRVSANPAKPVRGMEMGAAAIMANTAPLQQQLVICLLWLRLSKNAIEAGRKAYLSGLGRVLTRGASASDPLTGFLRD